MKRKLLCIAMCAAIVCGVVCAFSACHSEHTYGEWEVTKEPTCLVKGERTKTCTQCGEQITEPIDELGHDFAYYRVTVSPKCEQEGKEEATCSRSGCGVVDERPVQPTGHDWALQKTVKKADCLTEGEGHYVCNTCSKEKDDIIPKAEHEWTIQRTKEPKCETEGEDTKTCKNCKTTQTEVVNPLGHAWENAYVEKEASCEEEGIRVQQCSRSDCNQTRKVKILALGHLYDSNFTIDETADFGKEGKKSRHCLRCDSTTEDTLIPALSENVKIAYEFQLLLNNGAAIKTNKAHITISDENGTAVADSKTDGQLSNGVYKVDLFPKNYTVKVDGLDEGYNAQAEYKISYKDTIYPLWIAASPKKSQIPAQHTYKEGDIMYDFTLTTVNKEVITLSELLRTKKIVVLNFFFITCQWCNYEFPGMQSAYEKAKEDIAIIAIDPLDASEKSIKDFADSKNLTFYFVADKTINTYFSVSSYPATVVIDGEGVVASIHKSSLVEMDENGNYDSTRLFNELFAKYLSDSYWKNPSKSLEKSANEPRSYILPQAIMPNKKYDD